MVNCYLINLCNVIYKVIAKMMSNQFCFVLDKYIYVAQSAFVFGRLILDNVVLTYEILHTLSRKRRGGKGSNGFNLNMSKAYDRVK